MGVMEHIITEGQEEAYQSEIQYRNAQNEFKRFLKNVEGWRKLEFVSSILGLIALVALIIIAVFCSQIIENIILGSAVMDEYKFVNPSTSVKAFTLPPAAEMSAWITTILIIIAILAILYTIFKKCRYVSSLPRVCFPLYPFNTMLRGTARTFSWKL